MDYPAFNFLSSIFVAVHYLYWDLHLRDSLLEKESQVQKVNQRILGHFIWSIKYLSTQFNQSVTILIIDYLWIYFRLITTTDNSTDDPLNYTFLSNHPATFPTFCAPTIWSQGNVAPSMSLLSVGQSATASPESKANHPSFSFIYQIAFSCYSPSPFPSDSFDNQPREYYSSLLPLLVLPLFSRGHLSLFFLLSSSRVYPSLPWVRSFRTLLPKKKDLILSAPIQHFRNQFSLSCSLPWLHLLYLLLFLFSFFYFLLFISVFCDGWVNQASFNQSQCNNATFPMFYSFGRFLS